MTHKRPLLIYLLVYKLKYKVNFGLKIRSKCHVAVMFSFFITTRTDHIHDQRQSSSMYSRRLKTRAGDEKVAR